MKNPERLIKCDGWSPLSAPERLPAIAIRFNDHRG